MTSRHHEIHFTGSATVRDLVLGIADGLTVPFALAAGLSGAVDANIVVLVAGGAEVAAGAVSMGLGGYLAARSEAETYRSEYARETAETLHRPDVEEHEVRQIFASYGLTGEGLEQATRAITANPTTWVRFMMREELGLETPDPRRAVRSALTIGGAYVVGGAVPLSPYMLPIATGPALGISAAVTLAALALFGAVKGHYTGMPRGRAALQVVGVGGIAAAIAYGLARAIAALGGI
jgi:VIT1/CCC1 family predicted Fe2+/Mn2+ transporter